MFTILGDDCLKDSLRTYITTKLQSQLAHTMADRPPGDSREDRDGHRSKSKRSDSRERRRSPKDKDRHRRRSRERRRSRTPDSGHRSHEKDRDSRSSRWRSRSRSRSRDRDREHNRRRKRDDADQAAVRSKAPLPSQSDSFALTRTDGEVEKPKEQPNLGNSGLLAAASNSVVQADGSTITLKYHEPGEARKPSPKDDWKLFVFKGADMVDTVDLSARSCWLVGKEAAVVDLLAEHPSISKQHAVIQFRYTERRNEFGDKIGKVKPYLIDLESANGTLLNDSKVPDSRYLELRDKDLVQFGQSTREYVVMLAPKA